MAYFTPGQLLKKGQYEIIDTLGQGGFGITYLAQDHKRKKEVAIKSLNVSFLKQRYRDKYGNTEGFGEFLAAEQDKFNTEAMVLATFDHPHIVKVYPELFQENGLSCMVMEYVKGKNLEQYLYANGVFSESAGLGIIKGIGEALSYIHSRNYLHRDIKPANILLRESDNKAILIDCEDDWQENYINAPINGSAFMDKSIYKLPFKVERGSSWCNDTFHCRSAYRSLNNLDLNHDDIGFRVVCSGAAMT
jgi:serine/threonine protein kinase